MNPRTMQEMSRHAHQIPVRKLNFSLCESYKMNACNDGRCPLNRLGILHENHDTIQDMPVKDPCNDPRCVMNRSGIKHEAHDDTFMFAGKNPASKQNQEGRRHAGTRAGSGSKKTWQHAGADSRQDIGRGSARAANDILRELLKRLQQYGAAESQRTHNHTTNTAGRARRPNPGVCSSRAADFEIRRILSAEDPHDVFAIPRNSTMPEIKTRYRQLAKKFDPSKGIIHKSITEKETSGRIMAKINHAFGQLKSQHMVRPGHAGIPK